MKFAKHYYLIVDVETSGDDRVADFGAVVVDRKGNVIASLGVLVEGVFGHVDFHWALGNPKQTMKKYRAILASGQRAVAAPAYINRWLAEINATFSPVLTAYNIGFDWGKCRNTGIDLGIFSRRFDLLQAAKTVIVPTDEYAKACHENDWFTKGGKLSSKADHVARFVDPTLPPEPHTALEDARDYEGAILAAILAEPTSREKLLAAGMAKNPSAKWMLGA
ncbi:MAG: hypothetical protein VYA43_00185 [Pseudomonadota bacterium]|nr:hypothetical protein [Pseudomonadota bacterium]